METYHKHLCTGLKGTCSPWKSWASDRKLLTRAPEKRILHQKSLKINIFHNVKQIIYSFWRHFPHLRDAITEVMVNRRHTRKSNAVRRGFSSPIKYTDKLTAAICCQNYVTGMVVPDWSPWFEQLWRTCVNCFWRFESVCECFSLGTSLLLRNQNQPVFQSFGGDIQEC